MRKTIASTELLRNTVNGNPRYRFTFTDGTVMTSQSDASFCYAVGNQGMRPGDTVEIVVTSAGKISHMTPAS